MIALINIIINAVLITKFSDNASPYGIKPLINSCIILILWSVTNLMISIVDHYPFVLNLNFIKFWFHLIIMPYIFIVVYELSNRKKIPANFNRIFLALSFLFVGLSRIPYLNPYINNGESINISNNIFLIVPLSALNIVTIGYILTFAILSIYYIVVMNKMLNNFNIFKISMFVILVFCFIVFDRFLIYIFGHRIFDIVPLIFSIFYLAMYSSLEAATHNKSTLNIVELINNASDNITFGYTRIGSVVYANPQAIEALSFDENYLSSVNVNDNEILRDKINADLLVIHDKYYKKYEYNIFYNNKFMATGVNYVNITKEALLNEKLEETSRTDWLIGSKNRNAFLSIMNDINLKDYDDLAFIVLDLDNLKITNDLFGHDAGNEILKKIPILIDEAFTLKDYELYRVGGDEFIIIIKNMSKANVISQINSLYIKTSNYNKNNMLQILFSIGCAMKSNFTKSIEDLYIFADVAMYYSKNHGKNRLTFFTENLFNQFIKSNKIKEEFPLALKDNKIKPILQPVFSVSEKNIEYIEVYPQWNDEVLGEISYNEIIESAKKLGLIINLDLHILDKTCEFINKINKNKNKNIAFCVNFSIDTFLSTTIFDDINEIMKNNYIDSKSLIIQVDDSPLTNKINIATDNLIKLKSLGVKISLRDFGKGFANIDSINRLGNDYIKIHHSLMDSKSVTTIFKILKNQGCKIIAVDVDTEEKLDMVRSVDFDYMVGDYLSPYVDLETFEKRVIYEFK